MRPPCRSTIRLLIARPMPVPGIFLPVVQALEDDEDALEILRVDPDAVVADREDPLHVFLLDADMDFRPFFAVELDRIADQVLEKRLDLGIIRHHLRQGIVGHDRLIFLDCDLQVGKRICDHSFTIGQGEILCRACPRVNKTANRRSVSSSGWRRPRHS